jgi:hypothetical protein
LKVEGLFPEVEGLCAIVEGLYGEVGGLYERDFSITPTKQATNSGSGPFSLLNKTAISRDFRGERCLW